MSDPSIISITPYTVTKIATSVKTGNIHRFPLTCNRFLFTYRLTGEAAPSESTMLAEGIELFQFEDSEVINNSANIDIYVYAFTDYETKTKASSIRVDV